MGTHNATQERGGTREIRVGAAGDPSVEPVTLDVQNFCPEEDRVNVTYVVTNGGEAATKVRLELFGTVKRGTLGKVFLWDDTHAFKDPGEHTFIWDGKLSSGLGPYEAPEAWRGANFIGGDRMPQGVVTVEYSPYKFRVSLWRGAVMVAEGWSPPVAVTLHGIDLELGPEAWLSEARDREVRQQLEGRLPTRDQVRRLYLLSNQFKTDLDQMTEPDAIHDRHLRLHGDGPHIPIRAKLWLKKADGSRVDHPRALGRTMLLWDATDVPEAASAGDDFVRATLGYHTDGPPPGDNCHADRGGKRCAAEPRYFVSPTPFSAMLPQRRRWSLLTQAADSGDQAGFTGVLFRPSRMAGDSFRVWVFLASERDGDGNPVVDQEASPLPARVVHARTGSFQVWRRVHLQDYVCKDESLMASSKLIKFGDVIRLYNQAFLQLNPVFGRVRSDGHRNPRRFTAEVYNQRLNQIVDALDVNRHWALKAAYVRDAYDQGAHGVTWHPIAQWLRNAQDLRPATPAHSSTRQDIFDYTGVDMSGTTAQWQQRLLRWYLRRLWDWSKQLLAELCLRSVGRRGMHIFHFDGLHNFVDSDESLLQGWAPDLDAGQDVTERSAFILCSPFSFDTQDDNTRTIAHEVGHLLFLPHAPNSDQTDPPPGHADDLHDAACRMPSPTVHCLMGYDAQADRFCGLCQLRLRGWKIAGAVHPEASRNGASP